MTKQCYSILAYRLPSRWDQILLLNHLFCHQTFQFVVSILLCLKLSFWSLGPPFCHNLSFCQHPFLFVTTPSLSFQPPFLNIQSSLFATNPSYLQPTLPISFSFWTSSLNTIIVVVLCYFVILFSFCVATKGGF